MFQFISIICVLVLVIGGIYSAYTYFIADKESANKNTNTEPKADAIVINAPAKLTETVAATPVNPQITDSVTQAPKKTKKKRYYHSKPKSNKGTAPARLKQVLSQKNIDKIQRLKSK